MNFHMLINNETEQKWCVVCCVYKSSLVLCKGDRPLQISSSHLQAIISQIPHWDALALGIWCGTWGLFEAHGHGTPLPPGAASPPVYSLPWAGGSRGTAGCVCAPHRCSLLYLQEVAAFGDWTLLCRPDSERRWWAGVLMTARCHCANQCCLYRPGTSYTAMS